ncbi:hypothetical protein ACLMAL_01065 [Nocardia sp. CWNU-33]|uniref:hypothetical protein n=1 Tax=Nocardia sp. CWNU-33 TaxID=3392117 RepID=UPI00398E3523
MGDLCNVKVGPSALKKSHIAIGVDGMVPILRPSSLTARQIDTGDTDRTADTVAEQFDAWRVRAGDLLVVRVGRVEKAAIVLPEHHGYLIDSNPTRLRVEPEIVAPRFLLEFLLRGTSVDQIRATATVNWKENASPPPRRKCLPHC